MSKENLKFEQKIEELEKIVNELETGNISLEDSIEKYTKAMKLVKECDLELKSVEEKVTKIILDNGQEEKFSIEN